MIILQRKTDRIQFENNPEQFIKEFSRNKEDLEKQLKETIEAIKKDESIVDAKSKASIKDLKKGDKFYGSILTTIKDPNTDKKVRTESIDTFTVESMGNGGGNVVVKNSVGKHFKTSRKGIKFKSKNELKELLNLKDKIEEELKAREEYQRQLEEKQIDFSKADTPTRMLRTIEAGIKNIWLCGPAGCGNKRY